MPAQAGDRPVAHVRLIDVLYLPHRALGGIDNGGERRPAGLSGSRSTVTIYLRPPDAGRQPRQC